MNNPTVSDSECAVADHEQNLVYENGSFDMQEQYTCCGSNDFPAWMQRDIGRLSPARRETFLRFLREMTLGGASFATIKGYMKVVRSLGYDGKPYEQLTAEDNMAWMERISSNGWSVETVNWHRRKVKHFLRWVHGCRSTRDYTPEPIRCIRQQRTRRELPKRVLSRGEIRQLIDACENQRDRALVFVTYELGPRDAEILGTKIRSVEFDQFGAVIRISGKTGERRVRLIESVPDLKLWISMHPNKNDPDAPLWPRQRGGKGPLGEGGFQRLLEKLGQKAGLKMHIYPYLLRHTRATHLANVLTEAQMREYFGWTKDSDMPSVYVHLSGRDLDSTLLKHYGIKVEPPTGDLLEPKKCPWCQAVNSPSARFCQSCNSPLDPASVSEAMMKQKLKTEYEHKIVKEMIRRHPDEWGELLRETRKELEALAE